MLSAFLPSPLHFCLPLFNWEAKRECYFFVFIARRATFSLANGIYFDVCLPNNPTLRLMVTRFARLPCVHVTRYFVYLLERLPPYPDVVTFVRTTRNANVVRVNRPRDQMSLLDRVNIATRVLRARTMRFIVSAIQFRKKEKSSLHSLDKVISIESTCRPHRLRRVVSLRPRGFSPRIFGRRSGNSSSTSGPRLCLVLKATQQTFIYFGFSRSGTRVLFQDTSRTCGRDIYVCRWICTRIRATRARIEAR